MQLFLKGLTCPQPPVQLSSLTALLSLTVHAREAEGSLAVQDAYIVGHTVETLLGMAYDRGFRLKALHLLYVLAASTPLCVQHLQEALHFTTLCAIVKIAQDQSDFLSAARCCMIFDALLQIDEGAPRATASLLSLTDLGRRRDEQRQAMQWLAAEIADNCEDEGLRAAALHTAELADDAAPPPAVLRPRLSLSSLPSLVSRVSELAADSWRRPSDTATPRRLSGGGPPRSPALAAPSPMAPADESPGAYVPPSRRGAAAAGERRARSLAEIEEEQSRHPRGGRRACDVCGVNASILLLVRPARQRGRRLAEQRALELAQPPRHPPPLELVASRGRCRRHRRALEGTEPLVHGACRRRPGSVEGGGGRGAAEERGPRVAVVAARLLSHARECPRLANVGAAKVSEERRRSGVVAVLAARAWRRGGIRREERERGAHQLRRPRSARRELDGEIIADAVPRLSVGEAGGAQQRAILAHAPHGSVAAHAAAIAWTRIDTTSSSIGGDMPSPTVGEKPYR